MLVVLRVAVEDHVTVKVGVVSNIDPAAVARVGKQFGRRAADARLIPLALVILQEGCGIVLFAAESRLQYGVDRGAGNRSHGKVAILQPVLKVNIEILAMGRSHKRRISDRGAGRAALITEGHIEADDFADVGPVLAAIRRYGKTQQ